MKDSISENVAAPSVVKLARHRFIMHRILQGASIKAIAGELGYHEQSVGIIVRSAAFQRELNKLQQKLAEHLQDEMSQLRRLVPGAIRFYQEVLAPSTEDRPNMFPVGLKFKVSKDLMDRTGLKVVERVDVHHHHDVDVEGVIGAFAEATGVDVKREVTHGEVIDVDIISDEQLIQEVMEMQGVETDQRMMDELFPESEDVEIASGNGNEVDT